jgi:hypothetical protein
VLLGGAGAWMECYRYSKEDWNIAAGGELCGATWGEGCSEERTADLAEIDIYEFMDVPNFRGLTQGQLGLRVKIAFPLCEVTRDIRIFPVGCRRSDPLRP